MDIYKLYDELYKCGELIKPYIESEELIFTDDGEDPYIVKYKLYDDSPEEVVEANKRAYEILTSPDFYLVR